MEYRYFYRLGSFTKSSQVKQARYHEGMVVGYEFVFVCDKKFDDCGWDIGSWKCDNMLKEINEDSYKQILKTENDIKKEQRELGLKEGHHFPVRLTKDQVESMQSAGLEIIEL